MPIDYVQVARIELTLPRLVVCEYCHTEYVYEMKCVKETSTSIISRGSSRAKDEALAGAEKLVQEHFQHRCDPVPCPKCHRFQRDMSRELGMEKYQWVLIFLVPTLLAAGLGLAVALFGEDRSTRLGGLAATLAGAAGLFLTVKVQNRLIERHDGNRKPEVSRMAVAEDRAILLEKFLQREAERAAAGYRAHLTKPVTCNPGELPQEFVFDVWLKEEELVSRSPITVRLPTGRTTQTNIDTSTSTGSLYPLHSTAGEPLPSIPRVCVFNRTPSPFNR